jgi:hypothetical protein
MAISVLPLLAVSPEVGEQRRSARAAQRLHLAVKTGQTFRRQR